MATSSFLKNVVINKKTVNSLMEANQSKFNTTVNLAEVKDVKNENMDSLKLIFKK